MAGQQVNRDLYEIEWRILKFISESLTDGRAADGLPGVKCDAIVEHTKPSPALHWLTLLREAGVIEEPPSLNGKTYLNRFQPTKFRGDELYQMYAGGKKQPIPNPTLPKGRGEGAAPAGGNKTPMVNIVGGPSNLGESINHLSDARQAGAKHAPSVRGLAAAGG